MKECMITAILPVYNGEKYVERAIGSVLYQTYDNWQLVIVDDGSVDRTSEICSMFQQHCSKIALYSQENRGVSAARNNGLKKAKGDVVVFLDADDWFEEDAFLSIASEWDDETSLLIFDNYNTYENGTKKLHKLFRSNRIQFGVDESYTKDKLVNSVLGAYSDFKFQGPDLIAAPWAKAYKKDYLKSNDICFREDLFMNEDRVFLLEYICDISNIKYVSHPIYNYFMNMDSIVNTMYTKDGYKLIGNLQRCRSYISMKYDQCILSSYEYICIKNILWWTAGEKDKKLKETGHRECQELAEHSASNNDGFTGLSGLIIKLCKTNKFWIIETLIQMKKMVKKLLFIR